MDYFTRKAPIKTSSPEPEKVNCHKSHPAEKSGVGEAAVKQPPQKRSRKPGKCSRKLVEHETVAGPVKESGASELEKEDNGFFEATGTDKIKVLKSCLGEETGTVHKSNNADKPAEPLDKIDLSPIKPSKDKVKHAKSVARNSRKKLQQEAKESAPQESSLCDVSVEVNVDEESMLNRSTVTISFEDFVRSQSQDDPDLSPEADQRAEEKEETGPVRLDVPPTGEASLSLQLSPCTVTVQADVHVVSPKQEAAPVGKMASIFNRKKIAVSPKEPLPSPKAEAGTRSPTSYTGKRKSNVVLEEDDLELAVLESDSKCGETERRQFMAAFKQPAAEKSKTKVATKSVTKQKPTEEKVSDEPEQVPESKVESPSPVTPQNNKVVEKKPARKGRKKVKEAVEPQSTVVESDAIEQEPSATLTPVAPVLRRSRREAAVKSAAEPEPTTPGRKTRQRSDADLQSPTRIRKSKHGVFVAQMILCDPDTSQSPIR